MALTRITKGVIKPNENYDTHNINSTGIVTAVGANFTGNVSVGGTLTYEDVTSIDSVGIITAQNGIDCNGDLDVDGHTNLDNVSIAGVSTFASSIHVADSIIHHGNTNTKLLFGTDTIDLQTAGSTRLRAENSGVVITGVSTFSASAHVSNASGSVFFGSGNATAYGSQGGIGRAGGANYHISSSAVGDLCIAAEGSKRILFGTKTGTGIGGVTKRMSIASSGQVTIDGNLDAVGGIDATANSTFAGDIDVDGHTNLDNVSIAGVTTFAENINLSDKIITNCKGFNSGNEQARIVVKAGDNSAGGGLRIVEYYNDDTTLFSSEIANFYTNGIELKENVSITGKVGINSTDPSNTLDVVGGYQALGLYRNDFTGNSGAGIELNFGRAKANGDLFNCATVSAVGSDNTAQNGQLRFSVLDSGSMDEKLRITSGGSVNIGGDYAQTSSKLKVTGTVTVDGGFALSAGTFTAPGGFSISSGNVIISGDIAHDADSDTTFGFGAGADTFRVQTAGNERLRINNSGTALFKGNGGNFEQVETNPYNSSWAAANGKITIKGDLSGGNYWGWRQKGVASGSVTQANAEKKLPTINDFTYPNSSNGLLIASTTKIGFSASAESPQYANGVTMLFDANGLILGTNNAFDCNDSVSAATALIKLRGQQGKIELNNPAEQSGRLTIKGTNSNGSSCYSAGNSGKALQGIDITCTTVGDGNYGGAISFACGGNGRSAIAAVQDGSDDDRNGLAFFTHSSIHGSDNTVERFRVNANGDVTTTGSASFVRSNAGFTARAGDSVQITRASGTPLEISRTGNDGNMINFFRDTTGVAQIKYTSSSLTLGTSGADTLKVGSTVDVTKKFNVDFAVSGSDYVAFFRNNNANSYGVQIKEPSSVNNGYPLLSIGNNSGAEHFRVDSGTGLIYANSGTGTRKKAYFVRAWVNFDGTGGSSGQNRTINQSQNISSVYDNDQGDFTINFSSAMPHSDYVITGTAVNWEGTNNDSYIQIGVYKDTSTTSSCRIKTIRSRFDQHPPQFRDPNQVMISIIC